jgi:glutathione S-transferase
VPDFFLAMLARWSRFQTKTAYDFLAVKRLTDAMKARPSWTRMMAKQGIAHVERA